MYILIFLLQQKRFDLLTPKLTWSFSLEFYIHIRPKVRKPWKYRVDSTLYSYIVSKSAGLPGGAMAGISVGAVAGVLLLAACICVGYYRNKKVEEEKLLSEESKVFSLQNGKGTFISTFDLLTFHYSTLPLKLCVKSTLCKGFITFQ